MLLSTLINRIASALSVAPYLQSPLSPQSSSPPDTLSFELRHVHAVTTGSQVFFHDVQPSGASLHTSGRAVHDVRTRFVKSHRPASMNAFHRARRRSLQFLENESLDWDEDEIVGPDTESRETILELAKMTSNAYYAPGETGWYDLEGNWNVSFPIGWEDDSDGFRGHVFATPDNSTVVLSIKGTTIPYVGGGGSTTKKDKFNDNLLFSCCCARVGWSWTPVCDCYRGGWNCDQTCLETALTEESLFYGVGTNLYNNLSYMYPEANIWLTGHSLGGALASLLGTTFGTPVVAYEAPGERLAASRLHLPSPPDLQHITHVYNTADPVAMGVCNGVWSECALGGYAFESKCHLGTSIIYDTVSNLSWSVRITRHSIATIIDEVLSKPWPSSEEIGREVPEPVREEDCESECYSWEFGDFPPETGLRLQDQSIHTR